MKSTDQYLKFVRWSVEDGYYIGYCPDLFPWGGACRGAIEVEVYRKLVLHVRKEIAELKREQKLLPPVSTRPMREAVLVV